MKRKEFIIRPKHLISGLLIFIAVAILGFAVIPQLVPWLFAPKPAEIAAREGAQAFLSTDFEAGRATWEANVCQVASEQGCALIKKRIASMLWPAVERGKIRRKCQATQAKLVKDIPAKDDGLSSQVWQVSLICTDTLTSTTSTGDIDVRVSAQQDGWKFERVLFTQEELNAAP